MFTPHKVPKIKGGRFPGFVGACGIWGDRGGDLGVALPGSHGSKVLHEADSFCNLVKDEWWEVRLSPSFPCADVSLGESESRCVFAR